MKKETNANNPSRRKAVISFFSCFAVAVGLTIFIKEPSFTDSQVYVLFLRFFEQNLY